MRVAKVYEQYEKLSEPYQTHGRWYIKLDIKGVPTEARLYNDKEYAAMYPRDEIDYFTALGFAPDGFITLITGVTKSLKTWLTSSGARYTKSFGWYFPCGVAAPETPPVGITFTRLEWQAVSNGKYIKPELELEEILNNLLYGTSTSLFVGEVGDKIQVKLLVDRAVEMNTKFGKTTMYLMSDSKGNRYIWKTNSRQLDTGKYYTLLGTIKSHETYRGEKQNILIRCQVKEEG